MNNQKNLSASFDTFPFSEYSFNLSFNNYRLSSIANRKIDEHLKLFIGGYKKPTIEITYLFTLDESEKKGQIIYHLVKLTDQEKPNKKAFFVFMSYRLFFYCEQVIRPLNFISRRSGPQLSNIDIDGFSLNGYNVNMRKCVDYLVKSKTTIADSDLESLFSDILMADELTKELLIKK